MNVKVVNDNVHPYKERFRDQTIYIAPRSYVEMEHGEAHLFLGTMPPNIELDGNGIQKPQSYKMLRIEPMGGAATTPTPVYKCMIDGREFATQAELDEYIEENHADAIIDDKSKEQFKKERSKRG
jgi:hypothetical protein